MLQSPESRTQVVLPDKVSLPSILSDTSSESSKPIEERLRPGRPMDDCEFLERFYNRSLPSCGHETKIRFIWKTLQQHGRQRGGTDQMFEGLKSLEGVAHNVTRSYFWIQMVSYLVTKTGNADSYAEFIQRPECQQLLNPDLIDKYYSDRSLANGAGEFNLPDKKPIPNVVRR